ncbi:hypothetical protein DENSPDRAFT_880884 [Dentipellis sp. KUC8613]|nr:hypothetical protein DENSPDRAFT_880884 [Dentipellis sp. KUC8613]
MDAPAATYAASCNPPRRAKRPRTGSLSLSDPPALQAILPATPAPAAPRPDAEPAAPAPKRRGRKPSTLSRAARESMRRQNHSRIEKARRTKINDALATLRALVPSGQARRAETPGESELEDDQDEEDRDEDEYVEGRHANAKNAKRGGGREGKEKEFKLEVLERTVGYVQELQERIRVLEQEHGRCAACAAKGPRGDDGEPLDVDMAEPQQTLPSSLSNLVSATPRLPSISAWLSSYNACRDADASLLPAPDSPRAQNKNKEMEKEKNQTQLPTPPTSTTLGPTVVASPHAPPALALDLPAPSALAQSFMAMAGVHMSSTTSASVSASAYTSEEQFDREKERRSTRRTSDADPSPSPWTPEDESAASLLLQIRSTASPKQRKHGHQHRDQHAREASVPRVQTPASLLGMSVAVGVERGSPGRG